MWAKEKKERFEKTVERVKQIKESKLPKKAIDALCKIHLFIVTYHGWVYILPKDGVDAIKEDLAEKLKIAGLLDKRNKELAKPTKLGRQVAIDLFDDELRLAEQCDFYKEDLWNSRLAKGK